MGRIAYEAPCIVEWGIIPIMKQGIISIVEQGVIPMVKWGIIPIVEQGVICIVEWAVIPIVEQGVISIVEWGHRTHSGMGSHPHSGGVWKGKSYP